jgi:hypothetical protein
MISSPDQVNFFDPDVNACPYPAYEVLRNEAPVWKDPFTGMFVVTRHDDIRSILSDPETYTNRVGSAAGNTEKALRPDDPEELRKQQEAAEQQAQIDQMYIDHGWPRANQSSRSLCRGIVATVDRCVSRRRAL